MIIIGIKNISSVSLCEIKEKAEREDAFYRDYILSPIKEKEGEIQAKHSSARGANITFLNEFCKQRFSKLPVFVTKENEKPCFEGEDGDVLFSFSHSDDLTVCAVSYNGIEKGKDALCIDEGKTLDLDGLGGEVKIAIDGSDGDISSLGVDIQKARETQIPLTYHHEKIGERFFLPDDYKALLATPTEDNFYRLWTKTESLAKMTGEGIAKYKKHGKEKATSFTFAIKSQNDVYYLSVSMQFVE